jgi:cobalt-zinc-cadmium efflux system outer membrane protein
MPTLIPSLSLKVLMLAMPMFIASAYAEDSLSNTVLTFEEAIKRALVQQPSIEAYQAAARAAREQAQTAAQLPDPSFKFGLVNVPITGSDALRLNRENMTMTTLGVMQNMVRSAKRSAASAQLQAQAQALTANSHNQARLIQQDASLAWLDMFAAQKTLQITQHLLNELQAQRQVAATQLSSGAVSATELLQQDALLAMTQDQLLMAQGAAQKARSILMRWVGDAATLTLSPELPTLDMPLLEPQQRQRIEQHPLLQAAQHNIQASHHEAELADAADFPNWSWELMLGQRQSSRADMLSVQFSVDLPWQKQHRQRHQQAAALMNVQQAEFLAEDQQRTLNAELDAASAECLTAKAREQTYQQQLIPATKAALTMAQAAYQTGAVPLSAVWMARRALLDAELKHWLIRIEYLRAVVRLHYLLDGEGDVS